MINWIKDNFKDDYVKKGIFIAVVSMLIFSLLTFFGSVIYALIVKISIIAAFHKLKVFLSSEISIPVWVFILVLAIIGFLTVRLFLTKRKANIINRKSEGSRKIIVSNNKVLNHKPIAESTKILDAKLNFNSTLNSKLILNNESGIFSIWAYVADIHNNYFPTKRHMYVLGYATNRGRKLGTPGLADYPNVWAIHRITPDYKNKNGAWRFWCNSVAPDITYLNCYEILSGGWHLFSISWSKANNYIKFIIDDKVRDESEFKNWPSDFSASISLGTWPNKSPSHYFESKIGPYKFFDKEFDESIISELYQSKPE